MTAYKGYLRSVIAVALVLLVGVSAWLVWPGNQRYTVTAYFTSATGIYEGDSVRVLGVPVGEVTSITPDGTRSKFELSIDKGVDIPAEASAIIVAQSLVTSRFVQLTPVYTGGDTLEDGAVIPISRTAVPVEWDEIKKELSKLTEALGPEGDKPGALTDFLNVAGDTLDGNGQRIHDTIKELAAAMNTFSDGSDDLFGTIKNLQVFVNALADSNQQIVSVSGHLARVSDVLADSNQQLDSSLKSLDSAVQDVQRFLTDNRSELSRSIEELSEFTSVIADKKDRLAQLLHVGPTGLVNFYNIYQPYQGTFTGAIALNNTSNLVDMVCGAMGGSDGTGPNPDVDTCIKALAPVIGSIAMNYPPAGTNPITGITATPDQVVYTDPSLHNVPKLEPPRLLPNATPLSDADIRRTDGGDGTTDADAAPGSGLGGLLNPVLPQGGGD
ncbi:MCE family protein [Tomitella gaofuii]|uniref:MCE family protein n=1 Tax=Tomitella gaofuii TaxID=2760083 RepID=UPI0015FA9500|nr:MCE family protein [Tomitella gaofuii]